MNPAFLKIARDDVSREKFILEIKSGNFGWHKFQSLRLR